MQNLKIGVIKMKIYKFIVIHCRIISMFTDLCFNIFSRS